METDQSGVVYGMQPQGHEDVEAVDDAYDVDEMVEQAFHGEKVHIAAAKADGRIMEHHVSGVLHFIGLDDTFVCGRRINGFYAHVLDDLAHEWPVCQQCRRAMGEEAISTFLEA